MKHGITISAKIWFTFIVLISVIILSTITSGHFFRKIRSLNENISEVYIPTINHLNSFGLVLHYYEDALTMIFAGDKLSVEGILQKLEYLKQVELPVVTRNLNKISNRWPGTDQQVYYQLSYMVSDSLANLHESLLRSYDYPVTTGISDRQAIKDKIIELSDAINENLQYLKKKYEGLTATAMEQIDKNHASLMKYLVIMGVLVSMIALLIVMVVVRSLLRPLNRFRSILQEMSKGKLPTKPVPGKQDEIGLMARSLNDMAGRLTALSKFSEEIGKGNYESDFMPLSEDDTIGNSLIRMREDLKEAAIEESRRKTEDERRNWSNQGIARFSEILREYNNDIEKLNEAVISNLVNYTNARVGALFLLNRNASGNNFLELSSIYAYDRFKYLKKEIQPGEGLAGRCLQEGETIYLTDIPNDYIRIRSGLGEDNPSSILIVPLKLHEDIVGVVELASFETFEPYKIEFVEKIGTSIASTIAALRTGHKKGIPSQGEALPSKNLKDEEPEVQGSKEKKEKAAGRDKSEEIRKKLNDLLKKKK